ncbi:hypothetical protein NDU88_006106 [Pleurodeles waltl]|uniref:Uncharacterized protein n=1 Tax=Pleurodeles waltl TaxID=8319 RepID=A0AAV7RMX5_PLEWA|nr:hypothetical protein NDU88_006106 [Pleurodeles waltl]
MEGLGRKMVLPDVRNTRELQGLLPLEILIQPRQSQAQACTDCPCCPGSKAWLLPLCVGEATMLLESSVEGAVARRGPLDTERPSAAGTRKILRHFTGSFDEQSASKAGQKRFDLSCTVGIPMDAYLDTSRLDDTLCEMFLKQISIQRLLFAPSIYDMM